ncbi:anthranilate phosphoribosyltransferase [Agyrium rufum]|nr:anthranilate phosphoribosyltransferase [Agyrium rufum]
MPPPPADAPSTSTTSTSPSSAPPPTTTNTITLPSGPSPSHEPPPLPSIPPPTISIAPLLSKLVSIHHSSRSTSTQPALPQIPPSLALEISSALTLLFTAQVSATQAASLLTLLSTTHLDRHPRVIAACAGRMRDAARGVDLRALRGILSGGGVSDGGGGNTSVVVASGETSEDGDAGKRSSSSGTNELGGLGKRMGSYEGGLCDLVGTGGDGHSTFNISTTASIVASALLKIAKHGNRASSSMSGSADLLQHAQVSSSSTSSTSIAPASDDPPTAVRSKMEKETETKTETEPKTKKISPQISAITPTTLADLYRHTNYAFLFAPVFHPGMRHAAPIRKELGFRTIFNLLGPLANPVDGAIEARVVGVARRSLGRVFAEALALGGSGGTGSDSEGDDEVEETRMGKGRRKGGRRRGKGKALVVCGEEELDEVSCAGRTFCWRVRGSSSSTSEVHHKAENLSMNGERTAEQGHAEADVDAEETFDIEEFTLHPEDFGLPTHHLSEVSPGKTPTENASLLMKLLGNELPDEDPVLHFVLINAATLFVVSGLCDADESSMGEGDSGEVIREVGPGGGRWKEGVRRARWAIKSGRALEMFRGYAEFTNRVVDGV